MCEMPKPGCIQGEGFNMKTAVIICVRSGSNRIENKLLATVKSGDFLRLTLEECIERVSGFDVILAIPEGDPIQDALIGNSNIYDIFTGNPSSPLHRMWYAAIANSVDTIIRVTADDIFVDSELLRKQLAYHHKQNNDYTYMGNCPQGVAAEIISFKALDKIATEHDEPIEFTSYYLKKPGFKYSEYVPPKEYQHRFRLELDYPEDLTLIRVIYSLLGDNFGTLDIINLLKRHPELIDINRLPLITFYTCNKNYGKYIRECILSVVSQGLFDHSEYIILDDKSTDDSTAVILETISGLPEHQKSRIRVYRNPENLGLSQSSNKCLHLAKGRYVMRVDSDDYLLPGAANRMLINLKHDFGGIVSGYTRDGMECKEKHLHSGCALLEKRLALELQYKENPGYGAAFMKRFEEKYKVGFIEEPLWHYRKHANSIKAKNGDMTMTSLNPAEAGK